MALREKAEIFWLNKREYCIIKSPVFGNVVMIEVGATMVGSMIQTYQGTNLKKGKKKVILNLAVRQLSFYLRKKNKIDHDLLVNTSKGLETTIKMGERIGEKF